jgi:hypothetical protein
MKHATEEELIAYRDGEKRGRKAIAAHLKECPECARQLEQIEALLSALNALPVPETGEDYGEQVWRQIAPRLPEKKASWWEGLFLPRRMVTFATVTALILLAFFVGRVSKSPVPGEGMADVYKVRERVLVVAVGEHLGRSEMILMELANAQPEPGQKLMNMSSVQKRAEDLVEENRLYRQTASRDGDTAMANTLEELERVLLDIANSPDEVTPAQFESLQKRIESKGILFKVRVVNQDLREREKAKKPLPDHEKTEVKERNKA